jgi:uncharacterized protein YbcI
MGVPDRRGAAADVGIVIANAITKLHREYYGRGSASARTVMGRDHIVVFLDDIYTTVERTLIDGGKIEIVRDTRKAFQELLGQDFIDVVEQATGRQVAAFMSEIHVNPDVACEMFVLRALGPHAIADASQD